MTKVRYNPEEDALYWPNGDIIAACEGVDYLREFFLRERDTELGRWRYPKNPDYVVYKAPAGERVPDARHVTVSNESNGEAAWLFEVESGGVSGGDSWARDAARAYFAAHPEPKPWHDAKPGEVWELNTDSIPGKVVAWSTFEGVFMDSSQNWITRVDIISGKRIWPETEEN